MSPRKPLKTWTISKAPFFEKIIIHDEKQVMNEAHQFTSSQDAQKSMSKNGQFSSASKCKRSEDLDSELVESGDFELEMKLTNEPSQLKRLNQKLDLENQNLRSIIQQQ